MKTSTLAKISLTTVLALSLAAVVTLPLRSAAQDNVKGAQRLMELSKPAVTDTAPATAPATTPAAMSCPECKDKTTTYNASGKASIQDLRTTTVHGCPNCGTTIKIVGVGKAKEIVHVHTCSMETATVACCK